jgi:hypothetical protein
MAEILCYSAKSSNLKAKSLTSVPNIAEIEKVHAKAQLHCASNDKTLNYAQLVCDLTNMIRKINGAKIEVENNENLIEAYSENLKHTDDGRSLSDTARNKKARSDMTSNRTTAFTSANNEFFTLRGGEPFDEHHEYVHIISGHGGLSPLHHLKKDLNEGAINYFSEVSAPLCKVKVVTRYNLPQLTPLIKRFVALLGNSAQKHLFRMTFCGKIDDFFLECAKVYSARTKNF